MAAASEHTNAPSREENPRPQSSARLVTDKLKVVPAAAVRGEEGESHRLIPFRSAVSEKIKQASQFDWPVSAAKAALPLIGAGGRTDESFFSRRMHQDYKDALQLPTMIKSPCVSRYFSFHTFNQTESRRDVHFLCLSSPKLADTLLRSAPPPQDEQLRQLYIFQLL